MWGVSVWSSDLFSNTHRWLMWKILNVIVSVPLSITWDCSLKAERKVKEANVISRIRQAVPGRPSLSRTPLVDLSYTIPTVVTHCSKILLQPSSLSVTKSLWKAVAYFMRSWGSMRHLSDFISDGCYTVRRKPRHIVTYKDLRTAKQTFLLFLSSNKSLSTTSYTKRGRRTSLWKIW